MNRRAAIALCMFLFTGSACGGDPARSSRVYANPGPANHGPAAVPTNPAEGKMNGESATNSSSASRSGPTFDEDLAFLRAHGDVVVLERGAARVAVSPKYQGRVMTSAIDGAGASLGWINRSFITSGKTGTAFDNYGGEDRFWLGPEGGQFGLYFPPGAPFEFDRWQTPRALQEGEWAVNAKTASSITFAQAMRVTNHRGTTFDLEVTRTIRLLAQEDAASRLGVTAAPDVKLVAYESENRVTNTGKSAWTKETGLLSAWILAMFAPSPDANVIVPFEKGPFGEIVNDKYFGKVPSERLRIDEANGVLVFACDGQQRGKIGLGLKRAKGVLGSYSARAKLLTIVQYDAPAAATEYVNSMWETQKEPFAGDVVNSYNDGPTAPGKPSLGGFYEIETSSPALTLAPGASAVHTHRTFHFVGERAALDAIGANGLRVAGVTSMTPRVR